MKYLKKYIVAFTFLISIFSIAYKINIDSDSELSFFCMISFPMSIALCYIIKGTEITFVQKFRVLLFSFLLLPIVFIQLYTIDYFTDKELTKNGKKIKCIVDSYSLFNRGTTYNFSFTVNKITYSKSISLRGSSYFKGDTILVLVSKGNPNIYKVLDIWNRKM